MSRVRISTIKSGVRWPYIAYFVFYQTRLEVVLDTRNVFVSVIVTVDWLSWTTAAAIGRHTGVYLSITDSIRR